MHAAAPQVATVQLWGSDRVNVPFVPEADNGHEHKVLDLQVGLVGKGGGCGTSKNTDGSNLWIMHAIHRYLMCHIARCACLFG